MRGSTSCSESSACTCAGACVRLRGRMCVCGCANLVTQQGFLRECRLGTVSGPGQLLTSTAKNSSN